MTPADLLAQQQLLYYRLRATSATDPDHPYHDWVTDYMAPVRDDLIALMHASPLTGDVLELAPGTGHWTEPLSRIARTVTAVDGAPEMLEVLAALGLPNLTCVQADLFSWTPDRGWDGIFSSNWLAHVPPAWFDRFWQTVADALRPGGTVVFIDVTREEQAIERRVWTDQAGVPLVERRVNGSTYNVIKTYWDPVQLLARLRPLGWTSTATRVGTELGRGFVYYQTTRI